MKQLKGQWSRSRFIYAISGTGTMIILNPLGSFTENREDPRVSKIVSRTLGIDTHNHIDVPLDKTDLSRPKLDLSGEIKKSGLSAIVMTFATDYKRNVQPGEAYGRFLTGLTAMDRILEDNDMTRSLTLSDIEAAHKIHKPAVVQSVEGCHFLEGKKERVEVAYKRGLRHLGLLHDTDASVPLGDVYTNPPRFGGLTAFGAEVIQECNRLRVLIDLAHASNDTINAALKLAEKPVIISHTGLNTRLGQNANMARMMLPRLISKEQAKIVANAGGVIGVWTHLSDTPLEYAQNIRAMVDVIGVDHVCIGTDTKLTTPYRSPNDYGGKPGDPPPGSNLKHDKRPLNFPNHGKHVGGRTNGAWSDEKVGFYYAVVGAMLKTGFNEDEIGKIGGGNYCRVFGKATAL